MFIVNLYIQFFTNQLLIKIPCVLCYMLHLQLGKFSESKHSIHARLDFLSMREQRMTAKHWPCSFSLMALSFYFKRFILMLVFNLEALWNESDCKGADCLDIVVLLFILVFRISVKQLKDLYCYFVLMSFLSTSLDLGIPSIECSPLALSGKLKFKKWPGGLVFFSIQE